jgi:hypothetical protein
MARMRPPGEEATGQELKDRGIKRAAENPDRKPFLAVAREAAWASIKLLNLDPPEVSMNEVWLVLEAFWDFDRAQFRADLGNAAGAVFKCGRWEWTGRRVNAWVPEGHMNELRVWTPKGQDDGKD